MELYKAFNLCTTPMAVIIALGVVWGKQASEFITRIFNTEFTLTSSLVVFGSIIIAYIFTYFFISLHVARTYGKHLKELKAIMADLENE